jgi:hypothetical protein
VQLGTPPFVLAGADGGSLFWQPDGSDNPQRMVLEELPRWLSARGFRHEPDGRMGLVAVARVTRPAGASGMNQCGWPSSRSPSSFASRRGPCSSVNAPPAAAAPPAAREESPPRQACHPPPERTAAAPLTPARPAPAATAGGATSATS